MSRAGLDSGVALGDGAGLDAVADSFVDVLWGMSCCLFTGAGVTVDIA